MTKVIVPFSEKGGVGKTTTNVQLAYELGNAGNTVLLIDLDPSAAATGHLTGRADHKFGSYDVMTDSSISISKAVVEASKDWPNIYVLPADRNLLNLDTKLSKVPDRDRILKAEIRKTKSFFDYVLIDTPPTLGLELNNALYAATHYLVITDLSIYSSNSAHYSNELAMTIKKGNKKLANIGLLLNRYNTGHAGIVKSILKERSEDSTFLSKYIIPTSTNILTAQDKNLSLALADPRGKTTRAFQKLSNYIQEL